MFSEQSIGMNEKLEWKSVGMNETGSEHLRTESENEWLQIWKSVGMNQNSNEWNCEWTNEGMNEIRNEIICKTHESSNEQDCQWN